MPAPNCNSCRFSLPQPDAGPLTIACRRHPPRVAAKFFERPSMTVTVGAREDLPLSVGGPPPAPVEGFWNAFSHFPMLDGNLGWCGEHQPAGAL